MEDPRAHLYAQMVAGLGVPPEEQDSGHLVRGLFRRVRVGVVAVPADVPPGLEAVLLGLCLGCGDNFPPLQNDPRLALHISVVGVAEMDPEILYNLGPDAPLGVLPVSASGSHQV